MRRKLEDSEGKIEDTKKTNLLISEVDEEVKIIVRKIKKIRKFSQ